MDRVPAAGSGDLRAAGMHGWPFPAANIRHVRGRGIIWGAAILAAGLRFPGFLWPIKPDEAGFTLVARNWDPEPDSMYGTYWVDRPPS